jgi:Transposase DDE domain/Domain of unknown function (DUF4372)
MSRYNDRLVFSKITEVIDGNLLRNCTKKYAGDYRTQHFDTRSHLLAMIYFNLKGNHGLRDLQTNVANNTKLRRMLNVPSVSQFSRKNASRDYRIFEDIFYALVQVAARKSKQVTCNNELKTIKRVDSTIVNIAAKLAPSLKFEENKSAIKISTLFNGEYPEKVQIVKGTVNDRKCITGFFDDKQAIYVFDRGYYDYNWYDSLTSQKIRFVTRSIDYATMTEEEVLSVDLAKNIYDTKIILGSTPSHNRTRYEYREIMTFDKAEEPFTLITNIFDLSMEDIIAIYKRRWDIEVFFKWIKQNLKIKKWIGHNENAVKIQVYTALISYLLVYILKKDTVSNLSMLTVIRIVCANLLEPADSNVYIFLGQSP